LLSRRGLFALDCGCGNLLRLNRRGERVAIQPMNHRDQERQSLTRARLRLWQDIMPSSAEELLSPDRCWGCEVSDTLNEPSKKRSAQNFQNNSRGFGYRNRGNSRQNNQSFSGNAMVSLCGHS